jgi:ligand-binding sensor domain-containing protein
VALTAAIPAAAVPVRPIRFDHLSLEQGLSQSTVMDILQDRLGYVWLATEDGLNRYDGFSFKVYRHDPADATSLPSSFVGDVDEGAACNLWVATPDGLAMWERVTDRVVRQEKMAGRHIRVVRFDAKRNAVWIGVRDGGLHRLDLGTGAWTRFVHDPADPGSLGDDRISALYVDGKDRLWVGTEGGLDLLDGRERRFTHFVTSCRSFVHYRQDPKNPSSLTDDHVLALAQDRGGVLWVGTRLGGVRKWNPLIWQFGHVAPDPDNPAGLGSGHITSFSEDRAGRLWIGTYNAGMYVMERATGEMTAYRHDEKSARGLGSNQVMALRHDHRGTSGSGRWTRA